MSKTILTLKLDEEISRELDQMVQLWGMTRHQLVSKILAEGLRQKALERAVELYTKKEITLARAAEVSRVSLWDIIACLRERGIPAQRNVRDIRADVHAMLQRAGWQDLSNLEEQN